jgi:hypothetical protein
LRRVFWQKFADVSDVLAASIIRAVTEAASISEMSVNYQTTLHNIQKTVIFILAALRN